MSRIAGKNTGPEIMVRKIMKDLGYEFQIYSEDLPGKPDVVLPRRKKIVFVHGCFWHGHKRCKRAKRPATNAPFWKRKIESNIKRDLRILKKLRSEGWSVMVIWQCQTRDHEGLKNRIMKFAGKRRGKHGRS